MNRKGEIKNISLILSAIAVLCIIFYGISVLAVDSTPPVVTLNFPDNNSVYANRTGINFTLTVVDETNGSNMLCNLTAADHTWSGYYAPNGTAYIYADGFNSTIFEIDGVYNWNASCFDGTNWGSSELRTFVKDSVPPQIVLNNPPAGNLTKINNITYNWTATDALDSTMACSIWKNNSLGFFILGTFSNVVNATAYTVTYVDEPDKYYEWYVNCTDGANYNSSETRNFTIDTTGPSASDNQTNSTFFGEFIKHSLILNDSNNLSGYIFSFDNGTGSFTNDSWASLTGSSNWSNVTKAVNYTIGTTIQWRVYSNDSLGNIAVSSNYSYTTTNGSVIVVSLIDPTSNEYYRASPIDFNCSATQEKGLLANFTLYGNWSSWGSKNTSNKTGSSNSSIFHNTISTEGKYLYNCLVCDSDNLCNFSSSNITFILDTTNPVVVNRGPSSVYSTTSNSIDFTYTVDDDNTIKNCTLYITGDETVTETQTSNIRNDGDENNPNEFSNVALDDGEYDWYVRCYDQAGNTGADTSEHSLTITASGGSGVNSGNLTDINYSKTVPGMSRYDKIIFSFQNVNHTLTVMSVNSTHATFEVTSTPVTFTLGINQIKELDLNGNGANDFSITLMSITNLETKLMLKAIVEVAAPVNLSAGGNVTLNNNAGSPNSDLKLELEPWKIIVIIVVVMIIVLMFLGIAIYDRKKKKKVFWRKGH